MFSNLLTLLINKTAVRQWLYHHNAHSLPFTNILQFVNRRQFNALHYECKIHGWLETWAKTFEYPSPRTHTHTCVPGSASGQDNNHGAWDLIRMSATARLFDIRNKSRNSKKTAQVLLILLSYLCERLFRCIFTLAVFAGMKSQQNIKHYSKLIFIITN